MEKRKLVVGLGNPGKEYGDTRHNAGFMVLDRIISSYEGGFQHSKKFESEIYQDQSTIFIKPSTFMNLSGKAIQAAASFYKISTDSILVIHDDLDLDFAILRIRRGGTSAGHRGVESIISALGEDFWRLRIGIKNKDCRDAEKFVLKKFDKTELKKLEMIIKKSEGLAMQFIKDDSLEPLTIQIK